MEKLGKYIQEKGPGTDKDLKIGEPAFYVTQTGPNIVLHGREHAASYGALSRAALQSEVNCGKSVMGGGFNSYNQQETERVFGVSSTVDKT